MLAIETAQYRGRISLTCRSARRHRALDLREILRCEVYVEGTECLGQPIASPSADERYDIGPARQHPADSDLHHSRILRVRNGPQCLD